MTSLKIITIGATAAFAGASLFAAGENLLRNGDFEKGRNGQIDSWGYNRKINKYHSHDSSVAHTGKYSLKITGVDSYDSFVNHGGKIADFQDDLLLRGWIKYEKLDTSTKNGRTNYLPFIGIWTNNANGSNNTAFQALKLAPGSRDWFYFEKLYKAEDFNKAIKAIPQERRPASWCFRINVAYQPGTIWFDDLELVKVPKAALKMTLKNRAFTSEESLMPVSLTIDTTRTKGANATLDCSIANPAGKTMWQQKVKIAAINQLLNIDIAKLPAGNYTLHIKAGDNFTCDPVKCDFSKTADAFAE